MLWFAILPLVQQVLVPHAAMIYGEQDLMSRNCLVTPGPEAGQYYVITNLADHKHHERYLVDFSTGALFVHKCPDYVTNRVPCRHLIAAGAAAKLLADKLKFLQDYTEPCFFVQNGLNALTYVAEFNSDTGAFEYDKTKKVQAFNAVPPPTLPTMMAPIPNEPEPEPETEPGTRSGKGGKAKLKAKSKAKAAPVPMYDIVLSSDEEEIDSDIECYEHPDQIKSKEDQHGNKTNKRIRAGQGGKKKPQNSKKKRHTVAAKAYTKVQFGGVSMTIAEDDEVERSDQASAACAAAPKRTSNRNTNSSLAVQNGAKV